MFVIQKKGSDVADLEFAREALCRCVAKGGDRDGISACLQYLAAYTADGTTTTRQIQDEIGIVLRRFCYMAVLNGEDAGRARSLTEFYLDSIRRCEKRSDMLVLFESCAEMFSAMVSANRASRSSEADFRECKTYIQERLTEELGLETVAAHYGYHPAYFSRKFKQTFGETFKQYLLAARLDHAAQELCGTRQSILEISEKYCFCSQSHFQNAFRERFGMTPRQYRQQRQLEASPDCAMGKVG